MTAKNISLTLAPLIAFSLSTVQFANSQTASAAVIHQARETLKDIGQRASAVADEADQLSILSANTEYTPEVHVHRLDAVKEDVNRMAQEFSQLEAEHDQLAPWEQQAVDKALPLFNEAARNTTKAIEYFDAHRSLLWTGDYRSYAEGIRKDSQQVAKTVKDYLKYDHLNTEEQQLKHSLGG